MCGSRCDVITLLAALLAAVSLIGCATRIMIPEEEVASGFLLAHPSVEVKDTCPDVLAEYLMGEAPAEKPRCDELVTWEVRRRAFSMCCTSDGSAVFFTVTGRRSRGRSSAGDAEQWNILVTPTAEGTVLHIYRHLRSKSVAIPLSDGTREREFIDALTEALEK